MPEDPKKLVYKTGFGTITVELDEEAVPFPAFDDERVSEAAHTVFQLALGNLFRLLTVAALTGPSHLKATYLDLEMFLEDGMKFLKLINLLEGELGEGCGDPDCPGCNGAHAQETPTDTDRLNVPPEVADAILRFAEESEMPLH